MTDKAREKIAKAFWGVNSPDLSFEEAKVDEYKAPYEFSLEIADAILSALPEIIADMVEPLVWVGFVAGAYEIEIKDGGIASLYFHTAPDEDGEPEYLQGGFLSLVSMDELKATANAHNVATILAALGIKEGE